MPRENIEEALPLLNAIDGELRNLLSFCLGVSDRMEISPDAIESKPITTLGKPTKESGILSLWAVAARTFYPNSTFSEFENTYLKDVPFVVSPFEFNFKFKETWHEWEDYKTKLKERSPSYYELVYDLPYYIPVPNYLLYSLDMHKRSNNWESLLDSGGNTKYWHSLTPQNSDALALTLLENCRNTAGPRQDIKAFLEIMLYPQFEFSAISLFLFAVSFFQEKKDLRLYASEVLISLIDKNNIDILKFGAQIALIVSHKYSGFSRLVEGLIVIKDVSPLHNNALLQLFNSFFANLDLKDNLPTNFKKIVENYIDILIKTNQKPSEEVLTFFEKWKDNTSIKSLIKQILK